MDEKANMIFWDQMKDVPSAYIKPITGGRLSGKSDISPQWRIMKMTEIFGPIGIGWNYSVVEHWIDEYSGEVSAHIRIELVYLSGDKWSLPISGIGGSMLVEKEKSGPHHSDEAYKMATTDALSVAMKQLGIAANIYLGKTNSSKYSKPASTPQRPAQRQQPNPSTSGNTDLKKEAETAIKAAGWSEVKQGFMLKKTDDPVFCKNMIEGRVK